MESTNTRVLAYQLAEVIPDTLLQEVSGGGFHMTAQPSYNLTAPGGGVDVTMDYSIDF
jgi:hypothetical protein